MEGPARPRPLPRPRGRLAACGDDDDSADVDTEAVDGPTIRIAPQDFNEAKVLTEIYAQYLEAEGFDVDLQAPNGFRKEAYADLDADKLDLLIDYSGSAARFLNTGLPRRTSRMPPTASCSPSWRRRASPPRTSRRPKTATRWWC